MAHWRREADRLVIDILVRGAGRDHELNALPMKMARERLLYLAQAISPELYEEICAERDRCQLGLALFVGSISRK